MVGPANFGDEVDCGSFFDQIDDLLDFPADDIEACLPGADSNSFPSLWTTHSDSLPGPDSVFSHSHSASDLSAELSVPYEDIVQLEWLSNFVEDSFSGGSLTMNKEEPTFTYTDSSNQFRTSSPVSVLESSTSFSGDPKPAPRSPEMFSSSGKRGRPRTKRPRPASFVPRLTMQLISPNFPASTGSDSDNFLASTGSNSDNCAESRLLIKLPNPERKKKKMKLTLPLGQAVTDPNPNPASTQAIRKCMHCEITKTPQWRAGPMGPKTLCNACGVRYKSGRLFPEYRPAASPTFVPSLHSNSHKKVVEMRTKVCETMPELIPNDSSLYV